ncbi:MAG: DUF899 domain-containing protein [Gammaproteobacteria bacterium]|nr:MAG: DUF899 domain-containing protein [Gammaproteobacteria bacterium]TLY87284.1 MAG: DUF899 domain-containing protein [Gammaproteobacteria bacterium]
MTPHRVVSPQEWLAARRQLLDKEKAFTRARDELSRERRELPWERVEKSYTFEGPDGRETLADLFAGRSQLVVYHFMYGAEAEAPCKSCSFWADNFNGIIPHLQQRDVSMVAISRAPLERLQAFRKRLGWSFKWLSSGGSDFNYDYHVSFRPEQTGAQYNYVAITSSMSDYPGVSVFFKDESGSIFHTYSGYARGLDMLNTAYHYLDLVPKGRDEAGLPFTMAWVNYRDRYDT